MSLHPLCSVLVMCQYKISTCCSEFFHAIFEKGGCHALDRFNTFTLWGTEHNIPFGYLHLPILKDLGSRLN